MKESLKSEIAERLSVIHIFKLPTTNYYDIPDNAKIGDEFIEIKHKFPFNKPPKKWEKDKIEDIERWKHILNQRRPVLKIEDIGKTYFFRQIGDGIWNPSKLYKTDKKLKGFYAYLYWELIDIVEESE